MECDFCFEDSLFSDTKDRTAETGRPYTAKRCEPQWFTEDVNNDDFIDVPTTLKFRADLSYRQEAFQRALNEYSDCYVLLPPANNAMRRDVQESQARCLIRLGRYKEALDIADILIKGVSNTDHLTGSLNLHATIYSCMGNLQEVVSCLQQLISLHPLNPHFWIGLAETYMSLFLAASDCGAISECSKNNVSSESSDSLKGPLRTMDILNCRDAKIKPGHCNENDECPSSTKDCVTTKQLWMWSCASFIRARLLLQFVQPQHASFVLENNLNTQDQIEIQLNKFGIVEESKMVLAEVMGEDLSAERIKDDGQIDIKTTQTLSSFTMPTVEEFRVRWFHKSDSLLVHA
ncbi:uncharacterized protein C8orf76 homolog [Pseudophryne corroboree]|uniref:uncharacterized protein C8orf76 homolog n=1 Tax=Pseudophryne corroboree TaxID=495146 RepID=UPI00308201DC